MKNKKSGLLAVCGMSTIKMIEREDSTRIKRLYFSKEKVKYFGGLCKKMAACNLIYNLVEEEELQKLSGTPHHGGVVAFIEAPSPLQLDTDKIDTITSNKEPIILLDNIGNPANFGSIVRSAAFFGIKNLVVLSSNYPNLINTSSYRMAEGGMEKVSIYTVKDFFPLLDYLKGRTLLLGTVTVSSASLIQSKESKSKKDKSEKDRSKEKRPSLPYKNLIYSLALSEFDKSVTLLIGNEEEGVSYKLLEKVDSYLTIMPVKDKNALIKDKEHLLDSLNVAQAASILFYELSKKLRK